MVGRCHFPSFHHDSKQGSCVCAEPGTLEKSCDVCALLHSCLKAGWQDLRMSKISLSAVPTPKWGHQRSKTGPDISAWCVQGFAFKETPIFALLQLSADVLFLFLETWPRGVLEWRILHASWHVCVSPYCFLWSIAHKISLEFCGADESHGSGLSIWNLIFGIIMMLLSVHLKT